MPVEDDIRDVPARRSCPRCLAVFRDEGQRCPIDGAALRPLPWDPQIGALLAGRYRIEAVVGEWPLARVYRAVDARGGSNVAVKLMYGEYAAVPAYARMFAEHAERARAIDHPNVVAPIDVGETPTGIPFAVTRYVTGRRLADVVRADAPFGTRRAASLARDLACALGAIHASGLVHGDLTGRHVVVTADARGERAALELARPGNRLGTFPYRSPEQGACAAVDGRSDLYGLGVLLYEMLCGVPPFGGSALTQVLDSLRRAAPPVAERVPGMRVDDRAEAIALALLAPRPDDRFSHAGAACNALTAVLERIV